MTIIINIGEPKISERAKRTIPLSASVITEGFMEKLPLEMEQFMVH